jgi:hypothetical protein
MVHAEVAVVGEEQRLAAIRGGDPLDLVVADRVMAGLITL